MADKTRLPEEFFGEDAKKRWEEFFDELDISEMLREIFEQPPFPRTHFQPDYAGCESRIASEIEPTEWLPR